MAKILENGWVQGFDLSEMELAEAINAYKEGVNNGTFLNPCPPQFFAEIGVTKDIVQTVIRAGADVKSAYNGRAKLFSDALQWLRGEMASEVHWQGNKSVKTIFLLKQDWGDGVVLEDKPDTKAKRGNKSFTVSWGSPPDKGGSFQA